jgi:hypothetical protein
MKLYITIAAFVAQSFAASVIANSRGQVHELENGPYTRSLTFQRRNLGERQTPSDEVPRAVVPGAGAAPKDMQPKIPDLKPQPTPIVPGPTPPKIPVPVSSGSMAASPIASPVIRPLLRVREAQGPPVPKLEDGPTLPKIPKQPSPPVVPKPKIPVPTATGAAAVPKDKAAAKGKATAKAKAVAKSIKNLGSESPY